MKRDFLGSPTQRWRIVGFFALPVLITGLWPRIAAPVGNLLNTLFGRKQAARNGKALAAEIRCDVLIVGGGTGGTAAALAASEAGAQVCVLEPTRWLGGQLTSQGVSTPDEPQQIELFGGTRRYYAFREAVRNYYRSRYRLSRLGASQRHFNPGNCWVSHISFEPKVGAELLRKMLQPQEKAGRVRLFFGTRVRDCIVDPARRDVIRAVTAINAEGATLRFVAHYVLDATDTGELLPKCGREGEDWVMGAESQAETGEPDAPSEAHPDWIQPLTFPFALDWSPKTAKTNVIPRPADYGQLKARQNYRLLSPGIVNLYRWWRYRRILNRENFQDPRIPTDILIVNVPSIDYTTENLLSAYTPADIDAILARARETSLGYLYWLQTECPREDDKTGRRCGYPELRLRKDVFETSDGCSPAPYIRESRRIRSLQPILEQQMTAKDFRGKLNQVAARAEFMPDAVGIGSYALDIHLNSQQEQNAYAATRPFQIPLGALVPVRLENLLPASKDIGVTHLTNGAYRLHPVEWAIGEAAGSLAAFCVRTGHTPRETLTDRDALHTFQRSLVRQGTPLYWFSDVPIGHPAFEAVQILAVAGAPLWNFEDLLFRPDQRITESEWETWRSSVEGPTPAHFRGTRAQAAQRLYRCLLAGKT